MKNTWTYAIIAATIIIQACGNADRKDRDQEATLIADSLSDSTARAQAATADVDLNGDEKIFILTAASGGMMEVESANAALLKTKNPQIQAFARQMLKDHNKTNNDLAAIARGKGISPPLTLNEAQQKHLAQLKTLSGRTFDTQYMTMMIADHQKTVALFGQGSQLPDGDLKTFAANALPVIGEHYQKALAIGKSLNLKNVNAGDDLQGQSPAAGSKR